MIDIFLDNIEYSDSGTYTIVVVGGSLLNLCYYYILQDICEII